MTKDTFNKHLKQLKAFAKLHKIKVVFKDLSKSEADAEWVPSSRTINIDRKGKSYDEIIANFLHELGHFSDDHNKKIDVNLINKAYERFNKGLRMTRNQKKMVLSEEIRAWAEGEQIAHKMKIRLGKWYDFRKKEGILVYTKAMNYSLSNIFYDIVKKMNGFETSILNQIWRLYV